MGGKRLRDKWLTKEPSILYDSLYYKDYKAYQRYLQEKQRANVCAKEKPLGFVMEREEGSYEEKRLDGQDCVRCAGRSMYRYGVRGMRR